MRKRPKGNNGPSEAEIARLRPAMEAISGGPTRRSKQTGYEDEFLWKIADVARFLNVSRSQIYKLVDLNKLPCIVVPENNVRFDPREIRSLVNTWKAPAFKIVEPGENPTPGPPGRSGRPKT